MSPLVSIVIPCYNSAQYIEETLQSVLDQTYRNIEIIAVDDASTDDTVEILKKFNNVQLIEFQHNNFVSKARMAGADLAKGKYLLFLDSDDKIDSTFVEKCVHVLEKNPEIMKYDFYNPANILIINDEIVQILLSFLNTDYQKIDDHIYQNYTVETWTQRILSYG